jgi:hypothetical protein
MMMSVPHVKVTRETYLIGSKIFLRRCIMPEIKIYDKYLVEIDESGAPYYTVSDFAPKMMLSQPHAWALRQDTGETIFEVLHNEAMRKQVLIAAKDLSYA